jgi:hypothetical protein
MSTKAVRNAIIAVLQGIDGSTTVADRYTYDFTGTGQVESGKRKAPPTSRLPYACVYLANLGESDRGIPTSQLDQRGTFIVTAWMRAQPHHSGSRQDIAEDLLDDITLALRRSPTLGLNSTVTHTRNMVPLEADDRTPGPDTSAYAIVVGTVTVNWRENRP